MPELPEVETVRRHLAPVVEGRVLSGVEVRRDRTARHNRRPEDVGERLEGRRVERLGRRGKFLIGSVEGDLTWVIHLGMSGRIRISGSDEALEPHTHFVATTDTGRQVRFVDPRTFGFVAVYLPDEVEASSLPGLGPDALDALPSTRRLAEALAGRTAPIKALLLDQRLVAGLGNIYADEVLFRAGVHPLRPGGSLELDEVGQIRRAIGPVLRAGLRHGGTSLDDLAYLLPDGRTGTYLERLAVYGRSGEECRRCGGSIARVVVAQRATHFCASCQPEAPYGSGS